MPEATVVARELVHGLAALVVDGPLSEMAAGRNRVRALAEAAVARLQVGKRLGPATSAEPHVVLQSHRRTPYDAYIAALDAVLMGHRDAGATPRLTLREPVGDS